MASDNQKPGMSIADAIAAAAARLAQEDLWYGHGTDNPDDEAAWLVFFVCSVDYPVEESDYARLVNEAQQAEINALLERRIAERQPMPYLLGEAWFAGLKFKVDERVLIPRSPFAELIAERFEPWAGGAEPQTILEIGTGSGCIAIACALAFPDAKVVATDISDDALAVARENVAAYKLQDRLTLVKADLFNGVEGQFDLIVTNPPYVPTEEVNSLPEEYNHEPVLALESGADGLDAAREILQNAPKHMNEHSLLFLEVGAQWEALNEACPGIPFMWMDFELGGEGVGMVSAEDLSAQPAK